MSKESETGEWDKKHKLLMRMKKLSEANRYEPNKGTFTYWKPTNNREAYLSRVSEEEKKQEVHRTTKNNYPKNV